MSRHFLFAIYFYSRYEAAVMSLACGDIICVKVEGIGSFGEGLARHGEAEIFIPKAAPFDELEVEIIEKKKGRYRAQIKSVLQLSPQRVKPECKHFSECGGCDFQHITYEEQLAWKLRITKHWIRRSPLAPQLGAIEFDQIASPSPYHYRHRVRLQVKDHKLHFFKPHSNEMLQITECPILVPSFFDDLKARACQMNDQKDWSQSYVNGQLIDEYGTYELDGSPLSFGPNCFTQGNLAVNELIWKRVYSDIEDLPLRRNALDLFCGIGNFAVPLNHYFDRVTGVEAHPTSLAWAKKNDPDIRWIEGESEKIILQLEKDRESMDYVLLDPPRQGSLETCRALARLGPPKITYISCNLESLVRDLICLSKQGKYKIRRWTVADMFPQTHHIESVVTLSR